MSRHLPSLWQQPVSLSSQRDPLYPFSVTSEWMVDLSVPLRPDQRGGESEGINLPASVLAWLCVLGSLFFSRRPVEAVTRDRIREVPEERSLPRELKFLNVLSDRQARHLPGAGHGRSPLAAPNWIHLAVSRNSVSSLPRCSPLSLSLLKHRILFFFFFLLAADFC